MGTQASAVGIVGPNGRMGRRLCDLLGQGTYGRLVATLSRSVEQVSLSQGKLGADVASCVDLDSFVSQALDVVIDFSAPAIAHQLAPRCAERGIAYVLGSTGLTSQDEAALVQASLKIPTLHAANFSLGIAVLQHIAYQVAQALPTMDIEILDVHHRHKRDAPSGTANMLGRVLVQARKKTTKLVAGRSGSNAQRHPEEIGMAALRGGEVIGEHQLHFLGDHEQLCLTHRACSLDVFADGALRAAAWLVGQPSGNYGLQDMLSASISPSIG